MLKLPFLFFFIRIFGRRKSALPKYDPPGYAKRQVSILPIFFFFPNMLHCSQEIILNFAES